MLTSPQSRPPKAKSTIAEISLFKICVDVIVENIEFQHFPQHGELGKVVRSIFHATEHGIQLKLLESESNHFFGWFWPFLLYYLYLNIFEKHGQLEKKLASFLRLKMSPLAKPMGHWPLLLGKKREVPCIIDIKNGNELNIFRNRYWKMVHLYESTEVRKLAEAEVQF